MENREENEKTSPQNWRNSSKTMSSLLLIAFGLVFVYYNIPILAKHLKIFESVKKKTAKWNGFVIMVILVIVIGLGVAAIYFSMSANGTNSMELCGEIGGLKILKDSKKILNSSMIPTASIRSKFIDLNNKILIPFKGTNMNRYLESINYYHDNMTIYKLIYKKDLETYKTLDPKSCGYPIKKNFAVFDQVIKNSPNLTNLGSKITGIYDELDKNLLKISNDLSNKINNEIQLIAKYMEPFNNMLSNTENAVNKFEKQLSNGYSSDYIRINNIVIQILSTISAFNAFILLIFISIATISMKKCPKIVKWSSKIAYFSFNLCLIITIISIIFNGIILSSQNDCSIQKPGLKAFFETDSQSNSCDSSDLILGNVKPIDIKPILKLLTKETDKFKSNVVDATKKSINQVVALIKPIFENEKPPKLNSEVPSNEKCTDEEKISIFRLNMKAEVMSNNIKEIKMHSTNVKKELLKDFEELGKSVTIISTEVTGSVKLHIQTGLTQLNTKVTKSNFECEPFLSSFTNCHLSICERFRDFNNDMSNIWIFILAIIMIFGVTSAFSRLWLDAEYSRNHMKNVEWFTKNWHFWNESLIILFLAIVIGLSLVAMHYSYEINKRNAMKKCGEIGGLKILKDSKKILNSSMIPTDSIRSKFIDLNNKILIPFKGTNMNRYLESINYYHENMTSCTVVYKKDLERYKKYDPISCGYPIKQNFADFDQVIKNSPNLTNLGSKITGIYDELDKNLLKISNDLSNKINNEIQLIVKYTEPFNNMLSNTENAVNKFEKQLSNGYSSDYIRINNIVIQILSTISAFNAFILLIFISIATISMKKCPKIVKWSSKIAYFSFNLCLLITIISIIFNGIILSSQNDCSIQKPGLKAFFETDSQSNLCESSNLILGEDIDSINIKPILELLTKETDKFKSNVVDATKKSINQVVALIKPIFENEKPPKLNSEVPSNEKCTEMEKSDISAINMLYDFFFTDIYKSKMHSTNVKKELLKDFEELGKFVTIISTEVTGSVKLHIQTGLTQLNTKVTKSNFECEPFLSSFTNCHLSICERFRDFNNDMSNIWFFILAIVMIFGVTSAFTKLWCVAELRYYETYD
ncbi:unnamed protein product [Caenorhabditis angaria]|uniref:Uncharacterized protein n=1 Tax=Caenorhabditis angaria TaxID=860376 RepID=A0A9P1IEZ6_9PELO|nr:unnamed protein product [Caenorhabditis angaria]